MSKRHHTIGIKQAIRLEWMDYTVNLLLSGMDATTIRQELHHYLSDRKGGGSLGERSENTRKFVVNNLMHIWITPPQEIVPMRNDALEIIRNDATQSLAMHWSLISSVYPFWFNTATQVGKLLLMQDQVSQKQIVSRLKEQYGDRETIERYAKYVIRSFVYWGVLKEENRKGIYRLGNVTRVENLISIGLLLESALLANEKGKSTWEELIFSPAFFAFKIMPVSTSFFVNSNFRIGTEHYNTAAEHIYLIDFKR